VKQTSQQDPVNSTAKPDSAIEYHHGHFLAVGFPKLDIGIHIHGHKFEGEGTLRFLENPPRVFTEVTTFSGVQNGPPIGLTRDRSACPPGEQPAEK
jgi:hypothetical protein